jgi:hypothetical protein
MPFSVMRRHVALVRTDISEESITFIIRMTRIDKLGTTLAVTSNRSKQRRNTACFELRLLVTAKFVSSSPILVP